MEQIAIFLAFLFCGVIGKYWTRGINTGRWKMDLSADMADRSFFQYRIMDVISK